MNEALLADLRGGGGGRLAARARGAADPLGHRPRALRRALRAGRRELGARASGCRRCPYIQDMPSALAARRPGGLPRRRHGASPSSAPGGSPASWCRSPRGRQPPAPQRASRWPRRARPCWCRRRELATRAALGGDARAGARTRTRAGRAGRSGRAERGHPDAAPRDRRRAAHAAVTELDSRSYFRTPNADAILTRPRSASGSPAQKPVHFMGIGGAGMSPARRAGPPCRRAGDGVRRPSAGRARGPLRDAGVAVRGGARSRPTSTGCAGAGGDLGRPADHPEVAAAREAGHPGAEAGRGARRHRQPRHRRRGRRHAREDHHHRAHHRRARRGRAGSHRPRRRRGSPPGAATSGSGATGSTWWKPTSTTAPSSPLRPSIAVVTTLEADHLDIYGYARRAWRRRSAPSWSSSPRTGWWSACGDDRGRGAPPRRLASRPDARCVTYGLSAGRDAPRGGRRARRGRSRASRCASAAALLGERPPRASRGCTTSATPWPPIARRPPPGRRVGRHRRGARRVTRGVRAALRADRGGRRGAGGGRLRPPPHRDRARRSRAARAAYPERRIVAVFQPHLYSRTRDFAAEFGRGAGRAPTWCSSPTSTPAREAAHRRASPASWWSRAPPGGRRGGALPRGPGRGGRARSRRRCAPGDLCLTLGAGDLDEAAREIVLALLRGAAAAGMKRRRGRLAAAGAARGWRRPAPLWGPPGAAPASPGSTSGAWRSRAPGSWRRTQVLAASGIRVGAERLGRPAPPGRRALRAPPGDRGGARRAPAPGHAARAGGGEAARRLRGGRRPAPRHRGGRAAAGGPRARRRWTCRSCAAPGPTRARTAATAAPPGRGRAPGASWTPALARAGLRDPRRRRRGRGARPLAPPRGDRRCPPASRVRRGCARAARGARATWSAEPRRRTRPRPVAARMDLRYQDQIVVRLSSSGVTASMRSSNRRRAGHRIHQDRRGHRRGRRRRPAARAGPRSWAWARPAPAASAARSSPTSRRPPSPSARRSRRRS